MSQGSLVQILFKPEFSLGFLFTTTLSCVVTVRVFLLFNLSPAVQIIYMFHISIVMLVRKVLYSVFLIVVLFLTKKVRSLDYYLKNSCTFYYYHITS